MRFPSLFLILFVMLLGIPAYAASVDTVWDFNGNLNASSGASLLSFWNGTSAHTGFGTTSSLGLAPMYGDVGNSAQIMAFPAALPSEGYKVSINSGASTTAEYTMMWDVYYDASTDKQWRSLYQTNGSNSNDGDLFVRDMPWGGVGISGQYHGAILPNTWNRVAITRNASGLVKKYINGGYVGQQTLSDSRWTLDSSFYLFADDNNETKGGYVNSYRFLNRAMTQQEVFDLGGVNAQGTTVAGQIFKDPSIVTPGSFTIAVLSDSQNYSDSSNSQYAATFSNMTQWLVDNKTTRNIQFAMHVGDFVNSSGNTTAWNNAMTAMNKLNGQIPFAVVPGNHDYSSTSSTRLGTVFNSSSRFGAGSYYASQSSIRDFYADPDDANSRMNTYSTFEANGQKYLVLALEFGPRDGVVAWAKNVVDTHADYKTILLTHGYMTDGGARFNDDVDPSDSQGRTYDELRAVEVGHDESIYNPKSYSWVGSKGNDGEDLWNKIVDNSSNVPLVISGHQYDELDGFPYLMTTAADGDPVYQMLFDTQNRQFGGEGWIRLLEFQPDGKTVVVKTYSPLFNQWSYASDEYYTITLPVPEPSIACLGIVSLVSLAGWFSVRQKRAK